MQCDSVLRYNISLHTGVFKSFRLFGYVKISWILQHETRSVDKG